MNSLFAQDTFCPKCGTRFTGSPAFCGTCGASLAAPATPASSAPQTPQPKPQTPVAVPPVLPAAKQPVAPPPPPPPPTQPPVPMSQAATATAVPGPDQFIGPYRLLRVLGRGGMGVVYLGVRDDGAFRKQVALKLLLREMVNDEFVLRFKQERQVLAALDHPNIARILDGGDGPDGLPYYVMEYVEGMPIDESCDKRDLSLTGRIQTFQQVCQAVHYLNQNSIVHRDLKPSNVLVSNDGVVKLLDFGIAKVVGAAAMAAQDLTGMDVRPMTPAYASPEQIEGKQLTKASDIFSLGVILYRLLTGRLPYADFDDKVSKLSTGKEPPKPSSNIREDLRAATDNTAKLRRALAGELDSIVMKALRYNPQERYASAADLSADLQRFLDGQPVTAHHTTAIGRSLKIIRRQRFATAAVLGLLALAGFSAWEWQRIQKKPAEPIAQANQLGGIPAQVDKPAEMAKANPVAEDPAKTAAETPATGIPTTSHVLPDPPQESARTAPVPKPAGPKPVRVMQAVGQPAQPATPSQVTPEPTAQGVTTSPKQTPAVPAILEADRKDLEDSMDAAQSKVTSADHSIESLRQRLQQQNDSLNPDVVSKLTLMHSKMDRAKRDFAAGDYASARQNSSAAEALAAQVLKVVGR